MFRTLMTTRTQKRGVFRSFTKAAEPVCCASADAAERGGSDFQNTLKPNHSLLPFNLVERTVDYFQKIILHVRFKSQKRYKWI